MRKRTDIFVAIALALSLVCVLLYAIKVDKSLKAWRTDIDEHIEGLMLYRQHGMKFETWLMQEWIPQHETKNSYALDWQTSLLVWKKQHIEHDHAD